MRYPSPRRLIRAAALALALTLPALGPSVTSALATTAPSGNLAAVSKAIRAITTLKANFVQTDPGGNVQTGTLLLKQPGQIRFDYNDGAKDENPTDKKSGLLIVADGKSLNMIDYDVAQVQRWPIRNSPLGALLDPSRDLTRYGKLLETGDPRVVSLEVHDPAHPEYGVLTMVFTRNATAPGGLQLYGWLTKDAQDNRTTIRLTDQRYGLPISDKAFRWRDPRPNRHGPSH